MPRRPEILAPAGDHESLRAALAAGADAVYFGLDEGFNARARAESFSLHSLPEIMQEIHEAGARGYLTLNTLIFEPELARVEELLRAVAAAGVDAIIVQDPAVALLAREICPALDVHASTQMTVSSPEAARFAARLGVCRVVAPRELSVEELRRFTAGSEMELEVFVHGALCMSWSGQCLTSEAWGGRSANRGQCAQSCRLPYELVVDGVVRPLGENRYLLSPRDLAGLRAVPALSEMGISSLKIEGRYKGPAYVVTAVEGYRRWVDAVARGVTPDDEGRAKLDLGEMALTYSRGFSDGFLLGSDHQTLVDARAPKHRGVPLGVVSRVMGDTVWVQPDTLPSTSGGAALPTRSGPLGAVISPPFTLGGDAASSIGAAATAPPPRAGQGVVFDDGRPHEDEEGGPIFGVEPDEGSWRLRFGRPGPNLERVRPGQRVWLTSDPAVMKRAERHRAPEGRLGLTLVVEGRRGEPLTVTAARGAAQVSVKTEAPLTLARQGGLDEPLLRDKLCAFGGTPFAVEALVLDGLEPGLYLPPSLLKECRRQLTTALRAAWLGAPDRVLGLEGAVDRLRDAALANLPQDSGEPGPRIVPLCRTDAQLDAALSLGFEEIELDWMELVGLSRAVERARAEGRRVVIATPRVQKPGEEGVDRRLLRLRPDGMLVRHWGGLMAFLDVAEDERPTLHGDFSLNTTNRLTAATLLALGLKTLTAAHDLDAQQLFALLPGLPRGAIAVTAQHHISMFHTEHCVYAHTLSEGRDFRTCGRPCEAHRVGLKDPQGRTHPVIVDVGCRNTVFNAEAQSAAHLLQPLLTAGVRRLRVELVWEERDAAREALGAWQDAVAGRISAAELRRRAGAHEQLGVTAGTMRTLGERAPRLS
jgi:putative protease